ncbi:FGGY family carbohydrate kinase [Pedobacter endophyticus]|uniref:Carbohydrate kinase n=1 Tax=Pedobacter endophyticus TaxID=2789740 RepID=A0A7U3Q4P3_9SPHI|nr:FGGY family carbohydrate kinase [Pedobacter endophyticus]QPH38550.1 carbohydrate kinase [Pedobacter endophyticus]
MNVIAVFDIGKTNKKVLLFDRDFNVVYVNAMRFEETLDEDDFPCEDLEAIETWVQDEVKAIQEKQVFFIKAINFSTHGAALVYLNKDGKRITPLYNYLKPLTVNVAPFYQANGGIEEFSRKTASPAYGMLNSGLQLYWLKHSKPDVWRQVDTILHYPQYLSYLFSNHIMADYTSIGAHTALWDFDCMEYHKWLSAEHIALPKPQSGKKAILSTINGYEVAIGKGLHDSSASIIPLLEGSKHNRREFILLSTGTWIICMNPFSKETLTSPQLQNDCLCFLTPDKKQIKSSMQFLGHLHELNTVALGDYFGVEANHYLSLTLNEKRSDETFYKQETIFFKDEDSLSAKAGLEELSRFVDYEQAYYQLIFEISRRVCKGIHHILDTANDLKDIYISGGFNKNQLFVRYVGQMMPQQTIIVTKDGNASAMGAALLMKDYIDG